MSRRSARAWESVDRGKHRRAIELRNHLVPRADRVDWTGRQHEPLRDIASGGLSRWSQRTWHVWTLFARESGYLGFTHICGKTRKGKFCIKRITIRKRFCRKLKEIKQQLNRRMHRPLNETGKWLASVMRGYTRYYAVPGNMETLKAFYTQLGRLWIHAIRRRSQKAKTRWTWERFYRLQSRWIPRPRIAHPYPNVRFDAKHSREEPYAVVPHVRICA